MNSTEAIQQPQDRLAEFRSQIPELIQLSPEQKHEFVTERVHKLESEAVDPQREIDHMGNPVHHGFISEHSGIRRNFMVDPVYIDDPEVYELYLDDVAKRLQENGVSPDNVTRATLGAVQTTIADYTGNAYGYGGAENKNRAFYMNRSGAGEPKISIKEFKGQAMAVCAEKAALAQNILSFAGFNSTLICSRESELSPGQKEAHAYNLLHTSRGYFLYDPTNLLFDFDEEGEISKSYLGIFSITKEQYDGLMNAGDPVPLSYTESRKRADGTEEKIQRTRVYGTAKPMQ